MKKLLLSVCLLSSAFLISCDRDADPTMDYTRDAVLVSNEGSFQQSNASVSYMSRSSKFVKNDIIQKENNVAVLGDVLQHIAEHNDKVFMVLNNSGKIAIANGTTLKLEGEITNLEMPRYFAGFSETKAYVTEWVSFTGNGRVAVIDLATNTVTKTIPVGVLPEKMLLHENKLYVVNSGGNTVSVINIATDAVQSTITLTHEPNSLVVDNNGMLWVLSNGNKNFQLDPSQFTAGALTKINTATNAIVSTFPLPNKAQMANNLVINGNGTTLYYVYNNKVYDLNVDATALNTNAKIDRGTYVERGFYGLGVDPVTNRIYAAKAPSFTENGYVVRYNQTDGKAIDSVQVGIAPNGFLFR